MDGRLTVGTRVLQLNSISLLGRTYEEALKVQQGVVDRLNLLVCHGYDPSSLDQADLEGVGCSLSSGATI